MAIKSFVLGLTVGSVVTGCILMTAFSDAVRMINQTEHLCDDCIVGPPLKMGPDNSVIEDPEWIPRCVGLSCNDRSVNL